jgi:two-component system cell cycle sensor histidine kinase/response regulator CckA
MSCAHVTDLEYAAWPVFRVDESKRICGLNKAANDWFGERLANLQLSDIWTAATDAGQWTQLWNEPFSPPRRLKFLDRSGVETEMTALVCRISWEEQEQLLFQVLSCSLGSNDRPPTNSGAVTVDVAHKQKLDCALHLTRTVALDFNNALTTILGHATFVLEQIEPAHPCRVSLAEIEKAAEKASEVANQLALFSLEDKGKRSRTAGNLAGLLRRAIQLFQTPDRENVKWSLQLETRLYGVSCDEAKMQQAFVKLLENALEALGSRGGNITVQTRNLELSGPTNDRTAQLAAGTYVCVEIKDDGQGIEPADLPRVFEPFFTKKPGHRGLGLAWVYGIVTNHRGGVAISSEPQQGASVRVYLPATKKFVEDNTTIEKRVDGKETILFVDDEETVARLGEMVLSSVGYQVLTAHNGEQALEAFARKHGKIDLLVTDMVMPQMNGRELIEKVRAAFPKTRIICSTACVPSLESINDLNYLRKPFTAKSLLHRVREALDASNEE